MRALLGIVILLGLTFLLSNNKKRVAWDQVLWGLAAQGLLALTILEKGIYGRFGLLLLMYFIFSFNVWRLKKEPEYTKKVWGQEFITAIIFALTISALAWVQVQTSVISHLYTIFTVFIILYWFGKMLKINFITSKKWANYLGIIFIVLSSALAIGDQWTGAEIIQIVSEGITTFLNVNKAGSQFVFGNLINNGFVFALSIMSSVVFFASFMSIVDYLGGTSALVNSMARFISWNMRLFKVQPISGVEALVTTANIFFSMQSSPLMVRKYLPNITKSEVSTIIVAGLATIAGGTMAIFINAGIPAAYLLSASVMSAPAAICLAKILCPETEVPETLNTDMNTQNNSTSISLLGAASDGIIIGMRSGAMITIMIMGFVSLIALVDLGLGIADKFIDGQWLPYLLGRESLASAQGFSGIFPSSVAQLFGFLGMPMAWALGTPWNDMVYVGELLGLKVAVNEAVAYTKLLEYIKLGVLSEKSIAIASYALCGFANVGSLGILIGVMNGVVPERKDDFIKLGLKGMLVGAFASFMTAAFASLFL